MAINMVKCPLKNGECRHCSMEQFISVKEVGIIKTGKMDRRVTKINLGERCNNDGNKMVKELTKCPSDIALGVPLVPYKITELDWMRSRITG